MRVSRWMPKSLPVSRRRSSFDFREARTLGIEQLEDELLLHDAEGDDAEGALMGRAAAQRLHQLRDQHLRPARVDGGRLAARLGLVDAIGDRVPLCRGRARRR